MTAASSLLSSCRTTLCFLPPTTPVPLVATTPIPAPTSTSCLLPLLDLLTTLSTDTQQEVQEAASGALGSLVASLEEEGRGEIGRHLASSLRSLARGLRRSLGLHQEQHLERSLALLAGHLGLLQELGGAAPAPCLMDDLLQSLVRVAELGEAGPVLFGGEESLTSLQFLFQPELYLQSSRPAKVFLHLTSQRLLDLLASSCSLLARGQGGLYTVVASLLEGLGLEHWRREVLVLLGLVVEGVQGSGEEEEVQEALRQVVRTLLQEQMAGAGALERVGGGGGVVGEEWSAGLLVLETLGKAGRVLGPHLGPDTAPILLHLLHTTDPRSRLAATTLYWALRDLAEGRATTILALLSTYSGHLARELALALRRPLTSAGPGLPTLVRLVLQLEGEHQDELQDTVRILLLHLATSNASSTLNILNIVKVFVSGMRERMRVKEEEAEVDKEAGREKKKKGMVTRMILELEEERREAERLQREVLEAMECPEEGLNYTDPEEQEETREEEADPPLTPNQQFLKVTINTDI